MSDEDDGSDSRCKVRSNYFQTEFVVSVKKGSVHDRSTSSAPAGYDDERRKVSISVQTAHRSMVGAEEIPKERKRWVRPPLVGQASCSSDSQLPIVPVAEDAEDSEDEILESSQEPFVSTTNYPNRRDFISEKPPEGSCNVVPDNRAPSPASASSLTSGRPLEWDSGADVGYFQPYPGGNDADNLSSIERMALGGSASLLTRSDPEGTVSNSVPFQPVPTTAPSPPPAQSSVQNQTLSPSVTVSVIGEPNAESTHLSSLQTSGPASRNREFRAVGHLFPEVIIQQYNQASDSENECQKNEDTAPKTEEIPKRSTSLEDVGSCNQQPAPFVRSQSQNNISFHMSAHLLKMVQPQSNSSLSIATVVKGQKIDSSSKKESGSESGADGRANSFEYLPGTVFSQPDRASSPTGDPLKTDIEKGVKLLSDFFKGTQANNTILKKKLLKKVVEELITKKYPGEESCSSGSSNRTNRKNGSVAHDNLPSTWQGITSAPKGAEVAGKPWPANSWPLNQSNERCATRRGHSEELHRSKISGESGSQASLLARMDKAGEPSGTSGSPLESSSVAESSIKEYKQPLPGFRRRITDPKNVGKEKSDSHSSSSYSDWKAPATKSEKIYDQLKKKEIKVVDPGVLRYLQCERENQLVWIKKEIDHLSNLKALLEMHENLRKNVDSLKHTRERKERASSADHNRASRPKRRPATLTRSEPLKPEKVEPLKEVASDSTWDSHNYVVNVKGILKKNASTNTLTDDQVILPGPLKKPISYTIVFDNKDKENVRVPFSSVPVHFNCVSSQTSGPAIVDRETLMKESRERICQQWSSGLREELMNKKPEYVARAELRRQTVADLAAMRELRQKNRNKILAAAVTGEELTPPLPNPLGLKRVMSQKSMRQLTEKNYKRSSLVKQQQRERKKKGEMVTNRLMADMFNKNLQKRILSGETYLSNSVNLL